MLYSHEFYAFTFNLCISFNRSTVFQISRFLIQMKYSYFSNLKLREAQNPFSFFSLEGAKDQPDDPVYNMDKFFGEGVMFKCKVSYTTAVLVY